MRKLLSLLMTLFFLISCVQEIPLEELEEETFVEGGVSVSNPIPVPIPEVDRIAPKLLSSSPAGVQPSTTTSVVLQVVTDEKANCRFDEADKTFNQMFNILPSSNGGITHLRSYDVVDGESYKFYILCRDDSLNELAHELSFSVTKKGVADTMAPTITSITPTGELPAKSTSVDIVLTSSEASVCKYSKSSADNYDQMSALDTVNGSSHTRTVSPIADGDKVYFYCKDLAGNQSAKKEVAYTIKKEVVATVPLELDNKARGILQISCLGCHGGAAGTFAGLDLNDDGTIFSAIEKFVVKGEPDKSRIYLSLGAREGVRQMPPSSIMSSDDQKIIRDWILALGGKLPNDDTPPPPPIANTCDPSVDIEAPLTRRLTKKEIELSFNSLLGTKYTPNLGPIPADGKSRYGMTRNGGSQGGYSPQAVSTLYEIFSISIGQFISDKATSDGIWGRPAASYAFDCRSMSGNTLNTCLNQNLVPVVERAWRRVLNNSEKQVLYNYFNDKNFDEGLGIALAATFLSPRFLFISYDSEPAPRKLNNFEIAERLAFLVTARVPSAKLMEAAKTKDLSNKEILIQEMRKLFDSNNNDRLTDLQRNHGWQFFLELQDQWLHLYELPNVEVPSGMSLNKSGMQWGNMFYLEEMFKKNRTIKQMLTDNFVVVTSSTASTYGVDFNQAVEADYDVYNSANGKSMGFRKAILPESERKGLLTQAAVLAVNSHNNGGEVNPTGRGIWHADNIMCELPDGAPANIALGEDLPIGVSLKEKLAAHMDKGTSCFNCHKIMDPIGFGLWGYDVIGQKREKDTWGFDVDPSGELEGQFFATADKMIDVIAESKKTEECITSHITSFTIARDIDARKSCAVQKIMSDVKAKNGGLRDTLEEIVTSELFIMRKK